MGTKVERPKAKAPLIHRTLMQTLRMSGWLSAKVDDLKTATAADINSEDPGNIGHYYKLMASRGIQSPPVATILYVAKIDMYEGNQVMYFLKATNMPHTYEIYNNKLTPYCVKELEPQRGPAQIDARGYGAILPFMYNGGVNYIQWENDDGSYSQILTDVDAQIKAAKGGMDDANLPKPNYTPDMATLGRGAQRFYKDAELWGQETVDMFKELGIKTWEVAMNPTFNGRENLVGDQRQFQHFLECLQTQFEEAIYDNKLKIMGVFIEGESVERYESPCLFQNENSTHFDDMDQVISTTGRYNLVDDFRVECKTMEAATTDTNPFLITRFKKSSGEYLYYKWTMAGGNGNYKSNLLQEPVENFEPDFEIIYGRSPDAMRYADVIKTLDPKEKHAAQYESIESYANGVYVSLSGMRISLRPIPDGGKKVANTLDKSQQRVFLNILTKRIKDKKYIHLQDWKETSRFTHMNNPCENPLIFALQAMQCFQSRAFKNKSVRTEEMFIEALGSSVVSGGDPTASQKGRNQEAQFGRLMEREFSDMEHVIGDKDIKRDVLGLDLSSQGNQAIDTLHCSSDKPLWIATQVKTGERDKDADFHNFVNTFRLLREKALTENARCFGILIHYNGLKSPAAYEILSKEIGITVMSRSKDESREAFEQRCLDHIRNIKRFY